MVSPRNIRLALAILVVTATIGLLAAIFVKGSRPAQPEPAPQQVSQNIDVALKNARFTEMRDGAVVWELVAERAEYDKTGETAYLNGIQMSFAKPPAADTIVVTAAKGEYFTKTRNVHLSGTVHVVTGEGIIFDTDSIDYEAAGALFKTAQIVKFRHQRLELTAQGMELKVKEETAHFLRQVEGNVAGVQNQVK